jgi:ferritin-like metal-binding protein YciE
MSGDLAEGFGIEPFVVSLSALRQFARNGVAAGQRQITSRLFIDELRDAYDAEKQLTKALPKLACAATSEQLWAAFEEHLTEAQGHVTRLEEIFATLEERPRGKHCDGIAGIIEEGKSLLLEEDIDDSARDACLIAAGQRAEHYEMAAYGSLIAWARAMEHDEAADLLEQNLEEEKAAD